MSKLHIKKDDNVIVIAGADKGKTGKVLKVLVDENRAIVETAEGCGVIDGCEAIIIPTTIDNLYYDTHNTLFYYYDDDTLCGFDYNGTPIKSDSPLLDHLR